MGCSAFYLYADPGWGIGYIYQKEIGVSPFLPGSPTKVSLYYSCYDIETLRLLDCGFTQKIIGLKEPVANVDNNGGHTHNYDTHPIIEPPSGPLIFENGIDMDFTPFGVEGQTLNTMAIVTHPIPYVSGKIISEGTVTAPWGWRCVYNCYTYNSFKYEYTIDVGIDLEGLGNSSDYHVVVRDGTDTHPEGTYGTHGTTEELAMIAKEYFKRTGRRLSINDLSLSKGGLFDYQATWAPPHKTHRTGTDADLNRCDASGQFCPTCWFLRKVVQKIANGQSRPHLQCESEGKKHIDFD